MSPKIEMLDYVLREDPVYRWEYLHARKTLHGMLHQLRIVSQTWQGREWTHRLDLFVPDHIEFPGLALLTVGSDSPMQDDETKLDISLAQNVGMIYAYIYDVPNQPLFDGLREDELLAHSLTQYLDTSDVTWPLLFPMIKSAVRAMDTVQAVCAELGQPAAKDFALHGASKRGWTAWLTPVADSRVVAILPEVYDNLNLFAQMPHQVAVWEMYSEMIHDYTEERLQDKMRTPRGGQLALAIDPYTYRHELSLPKLLLNGTNDRYWATDALNLYWDDLTGTKYVHYAPNHGHHILDRDRIGRVKNAFLRSVATGKPMPCVSWTYEETKGALHLTLQSDAPANEARCWFAASINQDFREAHWESFPLVSDGENKQFQGDVPRPASGYLAVLGEIALPNGDDSYILSTQVRILGSSL